MTPAEVLLQAALRPPLEAAGLWLYLGGPTVQVVRAEGNVPIKEYRTGRLLTALGALYDDVLTGRLAAVTSARTASLPSS